MKFYYLKYVNNVTQQIVLIIVFILFSNSLFCQRVPAEFEKQDGIVFTWLLENQLATEFVDLVHIQMVENLMPDNTVYINYQNKKQKARIETLLRNKNIDITKIKFLKYDISMGSYPRDYGPEWIYKNQKLNIVDMNWAFYGYMPSTNFWNNIINKNLEKYDCHLAKQLGLDVYAKSTFVSEGGGKEFNGNGVLMVVEQTELQRNVGYSKQEIETEYKRIFNIQKIIWLPKPSYDDENMFTDYLIDNTSKQKVIRSASANGHIDEFCRFVSANTIVLAEVSEAEAHQDAVHKINKQRLDACLKILQNETDVDGKPYTIVRMPITETMYKIVTKNSGVGNNIFSMVKATKLKTMLDGTAFPNTDSFLVLPALSYCNFSIANNVVLISAYWREGLPQSIKLKDKQAYTILQNLFPNRKIIAIDAMALNFGGGGLHCNTKHIPTLTIK
jgi:agmatine deiminase